MNLIANSVLLQMCILKEQKTMNCTIVANLFTINLQTWPCVNLLALSFRTLHNHLNMEMADTSQVNRPDIPSPEEESEDENQNLLSRANSMNPKSRLQAPPYTRARSLSSPLSPSVLMTVSGACEHVRRYLENYMISFFSLFFFLLFYKLVKCANNLRSCKV